MDFSRHEAVLEIPPSPLTGAPSLTMRAAVIAIAAVALAGHAEAFSTLPCSSLIRPQRAHALVPPRGYKSATRGRPHSPPPALSTLCGSAGGSLEDAIVVGGGIGGLAAAVALKEIAGVEKVTVYEKASKAGWQRAGTSTGLSLFPNGVAALRAISPELHAAVLAEGTAMEGTGGGGGASFVDRYGEPLVGIRWAALRDILLSFLPPGSVEFDAALDGIDQTGEEGRVGAIFRTHGFGAARREAQLIVGSDGIRSQARHLAGMSGQGVRRVGTSPQARPRDYGRDFVRGVVPPEAGLPSLGGDQGTWMAKLEGGFGATMPVGKGGTYWAVTRPDGPGGDRRYSGLKGEDIKEAIMRDLAEGGGGEGLRALVEATDASSIHCGRQVDMPPTPSFVWGRLALTGDAAHAMPVTAGQGANTALEDAAQLGACVRGAGGGDLGGALEAYDALRRERCWAIAERSRRALLGEAGVEAGAGGGGGRMEELRGMGDEEWSDFLFGHKIEV